MAAAGIDALVLRPSPDFRFLGGRGDGFLVVTAEAAVETADPRPYLLEGVRRVGVDPEMRVRELFGLAVEAELVPAAQVLAPLRLVKEPYEVALAEAAARATEAVLGYARELSWFGATEREMAGRRRVLALEAGREEVPAARVTAGPGPAGPRRAPAARVIQAGDALPAPREGGRPPVRPGLGGGGGGGAGHRRQRLRPVRGARRGPGRGAGHRGGPPAAYGRRHAAGARDGALPGTGDLRAGALRRPGGRHGC